MCHILRLRRKIVHKIISGLPLSFKVHIECDEPRSLEEAIGKLKHCYEKSKHKTESKQGWKWNDKTKGKLHRSRQDLKM